MSVLARLGLLSRRGFGRVVPDPFVVAVLLSAAVLLVAWIGGRPAGDPDAAGLARVVTLLDAWSSGSGLWKLLAFSAQVCVMLVLGGALADAPVVRLAIERLAERPSGPRQLVALTAFVSIALALLNWSLSLVCGALLAKAAGQVATRRGWSLHYPILCAAGYSGLMAWHGGLSGTAPLKVTRVADLQEVLGPELATRVGEVPLDATLLSPLNLLVSGGLLILGPWLFAALTPEPGTDPDPMSAPVEAGHATDLRDDATDEGRLESSPWLSALLAALLIAVVSLELWRHGVSRLDLNTINVGLWAAALLAHRRPSRFLASCDRSVRTCAGVLLQFPLYAGVMGVMVAFGLSDRMTALVADAGGEALSVVTFLSAGVVNLFVPSGGGQWAVQGPIIVQAALDTQVPVSRVVMAMAYGDQWTNMLQPFWALPLLAITGVRARDLVGYSAIWMVVGGTWMAAMLLFGPV